MIVRAFKHVIRSVIAAVTETGDLAPLIAVTLNMMLGIPAFGESNSNCKVHAIVWRWLETFLKKRYDWELTSSHYRDLRKFAILRGLCHKVTDLRVTVCTVRGILILNILRVAYISFSLGWY